jgi:phosphopantothenoylcysteine decarboxylase / phosphopantothenate---cysteine ligase
MLKGKKIILGITGSIAAYKAAVLTRLFMKEGAETQVIMTDAATEFITPLTLSTLSKKPVITSFVKGEEGEWHNHVKLAEWADLILIAPATADFIAKMAHGICDHVLVAVYQSATCPVYVAPAMDLEMYRHPANKENIIKLGEYGNIIIQPADGELASGLWGVGRMEEPENILSFIKKKASENSPLHGKKVLITAGPTREPIDAVRYISNRSSGKMGYALAEELTKQGAEVTMISGPVTIPHHNGFTIQNVTTADEMATACLNQFPKSDLIIMAAAVADYTLNAPSPTKIKKKESTLSLELITTTDILAAMGAQKKKTQVLVGFALETDNALENAREKKRNKNLDMIVLNSLADPGAGFEADTNKITIIDHNNRIINFEIKPKRDVAKDIVNKIIQDHYS